MTKTNFETASNSDVLKRYGLSQIMRRAWAELKQAKQGGYMAPKWKNISEALKGAWAGFRNRITSERRIEANKAAALVGYTGPRGVRSPLNPQSSARFPQWGVKGNAETTVTIGSR